LLGQLEHGVYADETQGIHPETVAEYFGNAGGQQEGNGTSSSSNELDAARLQALMEEITKKQANNVAHDGIEVPSHRSPFSGNGESLFFETLAQAVQHNLTPLGYGVLPEEWIDGVYPSFEEIHIGRRRQAFRISLSDDIWLQRAKLWVQGLTVLTHMMQ
jgi:hypothetical protein